MISEYPGGVLRNSSKRRSNITTNEVSLTDPLTPGKLKKTSGPERLGICFRTFISFLEWLGCKEEERKACNCTYPFLSF